MIMGGVTLLVRPLNLAGRILLARMLLPSDFGAVALAMLFVGSSYLFVGLGMSPAIIHSDLDRGKIAFHAFVVATVSSLTITIFALTNSAWLATVLGDPEVEPILRVLLALLLLNAWKLVPSALLRKDMKFGAVAKSNLYAQMTNLAVSLVLALLGFGVWSLVIGNVSAGVVAVVVVWWLSPDRVWLKPVPWDWTVVKQLLGYGSQSTASGAVRFFAWNWDDWLVGRRLGTDALGFYNKAFSFTNLMIQQFGLNVVGGVFFPAYATLKENTARLQRAYLKSVQMVSTLVFPIGLGLLVTAPVLVPVLLGQKWNPMIETFQIFSILVLTRPISANTSSVFQAVGKPIYNMYAAIVLSVVMVPTALLLVPYGIAGVAVAVLLADIAGLLFNLIQVNRVLPGSALKTIRVSIPSLAAALIMFGVVVASLDYLVQTVGENIWSLIAAVAIGVAIYGIGIILFQRSFTVEIIKTIVETLDKGRRLERFMVKRNSG